MGGGFAPRGRGTTSLAYLGSCWGEVLPPEGEGQLVWFIWGHFGGRFCPPEVDIYLHIVIQRCVYRDSPMGESHIGTSLMGEAPMGNHPSYRVWCILFSFFTRLPQTEIRFGVFWWEKKAPARQRQSGEKGFLFGGTKRPLTGNDHQEKRVRGCF